MAADTERKRLAYIEFQINSTVFYTTYDALNDVLFIVIRFNSN